MQLFCFLTNTMNRAVINALKMIFLTYWYVELTSLTTKTKKTHAVYLKSNIEPDTIVRSSPFIFLFLPITIILVSII